MSKQDTDLPVTELMNRYGLVKSQVYARINALKSRNPDLAPFKIGMKSYVNQAVLGCLDEMHKLITEDTLTTEQAAEQVAGSIQTSIAPNFQQTLSTEHQTELSGGSLIPLDEQPEKVSIIAIKEALQGKPFARYEMLDLIAEKGWHLPTDELATILELQTLSGQEFERYGYHFTRIGKVGSQSGWRVEKRF